MVTDTRGPRPQYKGEALCWHEANNEKPITSFKRHTQRKQGNTSLVKWSNWCCPYKSEWPRVTCKASEILDQEKHLNQPEMRRSVDTWGEERWRRITWSKKEREPLWPVTFTMAGRASRPDLLHLFILCIVLSHICLLFLLAHLRSCFSLNRV